MACTFATESTNDTLVNPYSQCLVQLIDGLTPADTIASVKLGIDSCTNRTFRIGVYLFTASDTTGDQVGYLESAATTVSTPEFVSFNLDTPYTVPAGVTKLFVVVTASPNSNYSTMFLHTPGTVNSGYENAVTYSNIEAQTTGFAFNESNESLLSVGLCTGGAASSTILLPPPPAMVRL